MRLKSLSAIVVFLGALLVGTFGLSLLSGCDLNCMCRGLCSPVQAVGEVENRMLNVGQSVSISTPRYFEKRDPLDDCGSATMFVPAEAQYVEILDTSVVGVSMKPSRLTYNIYRSSNSEFGGTAFRGDSLLSFTAKAVGSTEVRLSLWNGDSADGYSVAFQDFTITVQ